MTGDLNVLLDCLSAECDLATAYSVSVYTSMIYDAAKRTWVLHIEEYLTLLQAPSSTFSAR